MLAQHELGVHVQVEQPPGGAVDPEEVLHARVVGASGRRQALEPVAVQDLAEGGRVLPRDEQIQVGATREPLGEVLVALPRAEPRGGQALLQQTDERRDRTRLRRPRIGAQQQIEAAQQQIDAARIAIAALLGKGPDRALSIAKPVLLSAPPPTVPSVLPSELLGHRPDVVAARWRVEAAERGIQASKASFYPTVNLAAMVGLASGGLTNLFGTSALLVQGGPAISLPIFDGGALRNQLAKSDADYDLAVSTYNQTLVSALQEVADALQAARALDAQIAAAREASDAASAAWKLAQTRYRAGLGTQLDVLAAQQPLLLLDQQLAALRAQRLNAVVDLDRALGGGLTLESPRSASDLANSR
jgi:NodT family efflux transporter outer membrane factor (OMF) lipoprotein